MPLPYEHIAEEAFPQVAVQRAPARGPLGLLGTQWLELCDRYLSVTWEDSFWRYSRSRDPRDPEQGWKFHVAATVLTANRVLEAIGPFLHSRGVMFKGPTSLQALSKLNCGVYYGYTLVGKCFTIYPQTTEEALAIAEKLHELTFGIPAPAVPFDLQLKPASCVYYRYGAFRYQQIENADGTHTLALRNPQGEMVPDLRESPKAKPEWVTDPFTSQDQTDDDSVSTPLKTTFRVFRALTQRGKGGVYQAVDFSSDPPRFCILKEGRTNGEPCWDGRDGLWRVKHEEHVLRSLSERGVAVPQVYSSFEVEGSFYVATEFIEGTSFQAFLNKKEKRLPLRRALLFGLQLSRLLSQIHAAGWVWRDCKPANLILTKDGDLRPIDFEGACLIDDADPTPWGTPGFAPLAETIRGQSRLSEDFYALGAILYYLLSGQIASRENLLPLKSLRTQVPKLVCRLVSELLDPMSTQRANATVVTETLETALLTLEINRDRQRL